MPRPKRRATTRDYGGSKRPDTSPSVSPRRRASKRPRRATAKKADSVGSDEEEHGGVDLSHLSKEERRRFKNRESAAQSRRRKREEMERLHKHAAALQKKLTSSQNKVRSLTSQLARSKETVAALEKNVAVLTADLESSRRAAAAHAVAAAGFAGSAGRMHMSAATGRVLGRVTAHAMDASVADSVLDGSVGQQVHGRTTRTRPVGMMSPSALVPLPTHPVALGNSASTNSERASSALESIGSFPIGNLTGDVSVSNGVPTAGGFPSSTSNGVSSFPSNSLLTGSASRVRSHGAGPGLGVATSTQSSGSGGPFPMDTMLMHT